jgi:hypothetical protein
MADAPDDERKQREERARRLVRRVLAKGGTARLYTSEFGKRFYQARMERETPEKLVEFARAGDREAHELLREYARGAARTGMHVPTALVEYVWECFIEGQPPAPKGPSGKGKGIRENLT